MADSEETWFKQRNKYPYLNLMLIMSAADCTTIKDIHNKLKKAGKWVDVRKFIKKHKHYNPSGLFEVFGEFSDQNADDVRDCLMGWILDNYHNVQSWFRMALVHKKLTLDVWMENMRDPLTNADDIALYLLCRMYDKHVYVNTARFGWCTIPTKFDTKLGVILPKSDLELVLLDCWSFGEVVKIRRPNIPVTPSSAIIPKNVPQDKAPAVIPQNVPVINPCKVSIKRLPTSKDAGTSKTSTMPRAVTYDMRVWPPPKKVTHWMSGRKRPQVDYSQYNVTDDLPPPPKKKRTVDLKRWLSVGRIAAEKYKTKPLNLPRPVRRRRPTTPNTPVMTSIVTPPAKASTSSGKGTVLKPATQRETDKVINQLLDIDMHQEENENEYDVPLAPDQIHVQPLGILPNIDKVKQATAPDVEGANIKLLLLPRVLGTAIKIETPSSNEKSTPKKKVFKTVEYKLKRKYSKPRKFSCVKCVEKFKTQKELNDHFHAAHPPVKCDLCQEHFDTPAAMLWHKYKH